MANYRKPTPRNSQPTLNQSEAGVSGKMRKKKVDVKRLGKAAVSRTPKVRVARAVGRATSGTRTGAVSDVRRAASDIRKRMG